MIDLILSLPTWVLVVGGIIIFALNAKGIEQSVLLTYVQHHETDSAARMLKVQAIQDLDKIEDSFIRAQVVNHIMKC
jgi:hypothetical protein